jgi:hypothetical protein
MRIIHLKQTINKFIFQFGLIVAKIWKILNVLIGNFNFKI